MEGSATELTLYLMGSQRAVLFLNEDALVSLDIGNGSEWKAMFLSMEELNITLSYDGQSNSSNIGQKDFIGDLNSINIGQNITGLFQNIIIINSPRRKALPSIASFLPQCSCPTDFSVASDDNQKCTRNEAFIER